MKKAVVLLSGGVDSSTLLHYVVKELKVPEVYAISFRYGQKHERELEMARWQANSAGVADHIELDLACIGDITKGASALTDCDIDVPLMSEIKDSDRTQPVTYVPNRNMMFLSIAASYAESIGADSVFYGAQAQDEYGYWDCTVDFVSKMNDVLGLNRRDGITVYAPFASKAKSEVVSLGRGLGVDYDHTWTCYKGGETACGVCPSCVERASAFKGEEGK